MQFRGKTLRRRRVTAPHLIFPVQLGTWWQYPVCECQRAKTRLHLPQLQCPRMDASCPPFSVSRNDCVHCKVATEGWDNGVGSQEAG